MENERILCNDVHLRRGSVVGTLQPILNMKPKPKMTQIIVDGHYVWVVRKDAPSMALRAREGGSK